MTTHRFIFGVLTLLWLSVPTIALTQEAPLFETRAVWFATVLGDGNWPESSGDSATKQANDLRDRIRTAKSMGINTFVMQVVSRGDAMYPSSRLPWSARLGSAGVDPGYDPLFVAVSEAHRLGMELHAWVNVYRIGDTGTVTQFAGQTNPGHVFYEHPEWVEDKSGALWLNPAHADARSWLVDNVVEIVENYDVDGVHFDFARYDQLGYTDDLDNFTQDPRGFTLLTDWRRNNVTLFIREASAAVTQMKNWVKMSVTPIGNYTPFEDAWPALWGFDDVYQESRLWLTEGSLDYLAPQIYFTIGREPDPVTNNFDSPDFSFLVNEWVSESQGRPIFAGMAPYKASVFSELDTQIAVSRTQGARGQVYFRYDHILPFDFETSYPTPAIPWPMSHRFFAFAPGAPSSLDLSVGTDFSGDPQNTLSWPTPGFNELDPLGTYSIFRSQGVDPDITLAEHLLDIVNGAENEFIDLNVEAGVEYRYQIAAVSRLGKVSAPSPIATTPISGIEDDLPLATGLHVESIFPNPASQRLTIEYSSTEIDKVSLRIFDLLGRKMLELDQIGGQIGSTTQEVNIETLPAGTYIVQLSTGRQSDSRVFVRN